MQTSELGDDVVLGPDALVAGRVARVVPLRRLHAGRAGRLPEEGGGRSFEPEIQRVQGRQLAEFLALGAPQPQLRLGGVLQESRNPFVGAGVYTETRTFVTQTSTT